MALENCPICGKATLIKTPQARLETNTGLHKGTIHSMDCLNKECNYTSGEILVKPERKSFLETLFGR
jgi:C4-type Zn-finger protein